ncbi:ras GTPase activating protein [Rutstroemia sp. NJR-2017a BBW]|nr:ras GTPase activating protein [Rutstroemia sp. NJR-2017a BBW]
MIAYEANKLKVIADIEKTPHFVLLLPLVQDPSSTVSSALDAHSALTSNVIADAKNEIVANGKTSSASESGLLKNHPYSTWCALFVLVARTPPTQQSRLVEFILRLQKIEVVDRDANQSDVLKSDDMECWRQLPGFGWEARNMFVRKLTFYKDVSSPTLTESEKTSYENQNAFLAQLLATSNVNTRPDEFETLDASLFALWVLRDAFENEGNKSNDLAIRSACWWLVFAAENLWFNVVNKRNMPDGPVVGGDLYEKKGWVGFNRERWEIWREGLRNADRGRETGKLVKDALACMERVAGSES